MVATLRASIQPERWPLRLLSLSPRLQSLTGVLPWRPISSLRHLELWFVETTPTVLRLRQSSTHLQRAALVVINRGIDPDVLDTMRTNARQFFHSPRTPSVSSFPAKVGCTVDRSGPRVERRNLRIDTLPDLKETFADRRDLPPPPGLRVRRSADNLWPAEPADFRAVAERYWRARRLLADELLSLFALALASNQRDRRLAGRPPRPGM